MKKKIYTSIILICIIIIINGCKLDMGLKGRDIVPINKCDVNSFIDFLMNNPDANIDEIYQVAMRFDCKDLIKGTTYQQRFQPLILENNCPLLGDLNGDSTWNVLDVVALTNCVLADDCSEESWTACAGDINDDGGYNVLDIVALANCVLAQNCGG